MRTLSMNKKSSLAIGANDFCRMCRIAFMTCYNNHKILYSIIRFVFDGADRVFSSFMMNQFPLMQIAAKMFSHYKTMLGNITSSISHLEEKVAWRNPNNNITIRSNLPTTFPGGILTARVLFATASTLLATQPRWLTPFYRGPSFLATTNTGSPNIFIKACIVRIASIRVDLFSSSYFSNFRHVYIIPNANTLCKGVYH